MDSRGEGALYQGLLALRGLPLRERFHLGDLYAVGGEGAIYRVRDEADPDARLVGKVALAPWHRPARLTSKALRRARAVIEEEAHVLTLAGSPFLPYCEGLQQFDNPLLEHARGGEFARPEPCLVMERLGGVDLDAWINRVFRGGLDRHALRPTFDRLVVGLLQALADLDRRGYLYADLRPGNLRVVGRPERRIRLFDAGGCVRKDDADARFPHVPSYLPPRLFWEAERGGRLRPDSLAQAAMAGRTLHEVATGEAPKASRHLDVARLLRAPLSPPVAAVVAGLAAEEYPDCATALAELARRARRRVSR